MFKSLICASTACVWGGILQGKRMRNGVAQSNVLPGKSVKNVRHTVSISSMRQLFVHICKGKYHILRRKNKLTKPSAGSTVSFMTTHQMTKNMVHKTVWNYNQW